MDSITQNSSESSEYPETSSVAPTPSAISSATTSDLTPAIIAPANQSQKNPKTYGSLTTNLTTEKLSHIKSFVRKTIKDEKADRLERKELDKVAIAKMRMGVDEYEELLDCLQKEREFSRDFSGKSKVEGRGSGEQGGEGEEEKVEVSREELDMISLRRQLAMMRKRS